MSQPLTDSEIFDAGECPHFFRGKAGPTIKILLYTDDPIDVQDDVVKDWSLGVMLRHIQTHAPAFASLCIKLICRNSTPMNHADNTIDDLIQKEVFDQIWFFGIHQGNRANFSMGVLRGGPHSELNDAEVKALEKWMQVGDDDGQRGGGVLMTGDHAEPRPPDALPPATAPAPGGGSGIEEFWGLGRALGAHVPRAGQMRAWEGPPTRRVADSQNTQVFSSGSNFEDVLLQFDPVPQLLILQLFDAKGEPAEKGQPHPLFFYGQETFIHVYPDHVHEGTVVIPKDEQLANAALWPNGQTVKPHVVARGTDNSKRLIVNLVAAYNGDRVRRGRIVSDSTWHHYFNVNLNRFMPPGEVNSSTDQIGQYYGNLAVWLTPLMKRREMAAAMIEWLATHPLLLEERVLEDLTDEQWSEVLLYLGAKAHHLLSQVASSCEIHELLGALIPDSTSARVETLYLPQKGFAVSSLGPTKLLLPSKELLLGCFTNLYHREVARAESSGNTPSLRLQALDNAFADGFNRALRVQNSYITRLASASQNWFE